MENGTPAAQRSPSSTKPILNDNNHKQQRKTKSATPANSNGSFDQAKLKPAREPMKSEVMFPSYAHCVLRSVHLLTIFAYFEYLLNYDFQALLKDISFTF
jgi:hypothetical protein